MVNSVTSTSATTTATVINPSHQASNHLKKRILKSNKRVHPEGQDADQAYWVSIPTAILTTYDVASLPVIGVMAMSLECCGY
jgi:hypothetical protein